MKYRKDVFTYHITRDKLASQNFLFLAIADHSCPHCNVSFETGNNVCCLFFLIPANGSVETQDTNDDTKIDPVIQTSSKQNRQLHHYDQIRCRAHEDGLYIDKK